MSYRRCAAAWLARAGCLCAQVLWVLRFGSWPNGRCAHEPRSQATGRPRPDGLLPVPGDRYLHCPQHDRRLRCTGDGLHRRFGVRRVATQRGADRSAAQCRSVRHGRRFAVYRALGRPLRAPAADPVLPAAVGCRHAAFGRQPEPFATGAVARPDRPGHRRHPGQQQRDRRRVFQPPLARPGGQPAIHRLCPGRDPGRAAGGVAVDSLGLALGVPVRRHRHLAGDPPGAALAPRIPGLSPGPAAGRCPGANQSPGRAPGPSATAANARGSGTRAGRRQRF